ncbi:MAG TPA: tetratricopeptide repeat protein [Anaerolineae bacterium]|nr:tetratricopeptide repeat protein [Anaerolineae bacterium]HNU03308.1 tetratricopeptide repeat protein [Anaerolineae bacterium]
MSKKKAVRPPQLSPSQRHSADALSAEERAVQRAQIEAEQAQRRRQQGFELLAEGARLLAQNRPDEAAAHLERAAALLPENPDVAINLGGAYVLQRRYNKAVAVLERASLLAPDNAMVWTNLAAAYLGSLQLSGPQQQRKAIAAYEAALQADPATPHVHYNLGLIHHDRQEHAQAEFWFRRALEVDPNDRDAHRWLARLAAAAEADDAQPAPPADRADLSDEAERG